MRGIKVFPFGTDSICKQWTAIIKSMGKYHSFGTHDSDILSSFDKAATKEGKRSYEDDKSA